MKTYLFATKAVAHGYAFKDQGDNAKNAAYALSHYANNGRTETLFSSTKELPLEGGFYSPLITLETSNGSLTYYVSARGKRETERELQGNHGIKAFTREGGLEELTNVACSFFFNNK